MQRTWTRCSSGFVVVGRSALSAASSPHRAAPYRELRIIRRGGLRIIWLSLLPLGPRDRGALWHRSGSRRSSAPIVARPRHNAVDGGAAGWRSRQLRYVLSIHIHSQAEVFVLFHRAAHGAHSPHHSLNSITTPQAQRTAPHSSVNISPCVQGFSCRLLPYAAGRDCDRQSGAQVGEGGGGCGCIALSSMTNSHLRVTAQARDKLTPLPSCSKPHARITLSTLSTPHVL